MTWNWPADWLIILGWSFSYPLWQWRFVVNNANTIVCICVCVCDRVAWFCGRCWCAVKWNRLLRKFSSSKDRLFCASTTKGLFELLMMTFAGWLRGVVTCQRVVRWCIITILLFSVRPFVCRHPVNERLWRKLQNCYSNRNVSFSAAIKQP